MLSFYFKSISICRGVCICGGVCPEQSLTGAPDMTPVAWRSQRLSPCCLVATVCVLLSCSQGVCPVARVCPPVARVCVLLSCSHGVCPAVARVCSLLPPSEVERASHRHSPTGCHSKPVLQQRACSFFNWANRGPHIAFP